MWVHYFAEVDVTIWSWGHVYCSRNLLFIAGVLRIVCAHVIHGIMGGMLTLMRHIHRLTCSCMLTQLSKIQFDLMWSCTQLQFDLTCYNCQFDLTCSCTQDPVWSCIFLYTHTHTDNCPRSSLTIRHCLRQQSSCCIWRFAATASTTCSLPSIR